jgi:hypothetical protein
VQAPSANATGLLPNPLTTKPGSPAGGGASGEKDRAPGTPEARREKIAGQIADLGSEIEPYAAIIALYSDFAYDSAEDMDGAFGDLVDGLKSMNIIDSERKEYELMCSCVEIHAENSGYAVYDINNDGIPELFVMSEDYFIYAIFSMHNKTPVFVGGYWSQHSCAVDGSATLYVNASSGVSDKYCATYLLISAAEDLKLIEMFGSESRDDKTGEFLPEPRFFRIAGGVREIIGEEEAKVLWESFPSVYVDNPSKNAGLAYIPFA